MLVFAVLLCIEVFIMLRKFPFEEDIHLDPSRQFRSKNKKLLQLFSSDRVLIRQLDDFGIFFFIKKELQSRYKVKISHVEQQRVLIIEVLFLL